MNDQIKEIITKAKLNFAILAGILALAVVGKFTNPEFTNTVFVTADQLVSDLYIVFIAITLGAFVPNFKLVAFGSIGAFIGAVAPMAAVAAVAEGHWLALVLPLQHARALRRSPDRGPQLFPCL